MHRRFSSVGSLMLSCRLILSLLMTSSLSEGLCRPFYRIILLMHFMAIYLENLLAEVFSHMVTVFIQTRISIANNLELSLTKFERNENLRVLSFHCSLQTNLF